MANNSRDAVLYGRLQGAFQRDLLSVYINFDMLQSPKSPIFDPWLAVGPLLGLLLLSLALLLVGGMLIGTGAMVVAVVLYVMVLRPWLEQVFRQKAIEAMMLDMRSFLMLWEYGGVGVSLVDRPTTMVAAPEGHWRAFVLRHLPDVSVESLDPEMVAQFQDHHMPGYDEAMDRRVLDLNTVHIPGHPLEGEILPSEDSESKEKDL